MDMNQLTSPSSSLPPSQQNSYQLVEFIDSRAYVPVYVVDGSLYYDVKSNLSPNVDHIITLNSRNERIKEDADDLTSSSLNTSHSNLDTNSYYFAKTFLFPNSSIDSTSEKYKRDMNVIRLLKIQPLLFTYDENVPRSIQSSNLTSTMTDSNNSTVVYNPFDNLAAQKSSLKIYVYWDETVCLSLSQVKDPKALLFPVQGKTPLEAFDSLVSFLNDFLKSRQPFLTSSTATSISNSALPSVTSNDSSQTTSIKELVLYYPDKLGTTPSSFRSRTVYRTGGMDFNALLVEDTWDRFSRLIQPAVLVRYEDLHARDISNEEYDEKEEDKSEASEIVPQSIPSTPLREDAAVINSVNPSATVHMIEGASSSQNYYTFPTMDRMDSGRANGEDEQQIENSYTSLCEYEWTKVDLSVSGDGRSDSDGAMCDRLEIMAINNLHISGLTPELQSAVLRVATRPVRLLVKRHTSTISSPEVIYSESAGSHQPLSTHINTAENVECHDNSIIESPATAIDINSAVLPATKIDTNTNERDSSKWKMLEYEDDETEQGFEDDDDVVHVPMTKSLTMIVEGQKSEDTVDNEPLSSPSLESTQSDASVPIHLLSSSKHTSSARNEISFELFLLKYNHSLGKPLRKKVDLLINAYRECDWCQAAVEGSGTPQATIVSLYRFAESEMRRLGLFDGSKPQGVGMPIVLQDRHREQIKSHIESYIFTKIQDYTLQIAPSVYAALHLKEENPDEQLNDIRVANTSRSVTVTPVRRPKSARINTPADPVSSSSIAFSSASRASGPSSLATTPRFAFQEYMCTSIDPNRKHSVVSMINAKIATLRFLTLDDLGLSPEHNDLDHSSTLSTTQTSNKTMLVDWHLALKSLCDALQESTPATILTRLVYFHRLLVSLVQAYLCHNPNSQSVISHNPTTRSQIGSPLSTTRSVSINRPKTYDVTCRFCGSTHRAESANITDSSQKISSNSVSLYGKSCLPCSNSTVLDSSGRSSRVMSRIIPSADLSRSTVQSTQPNIPKSNTKVSDDSNSKLQVHDDNGDVSGLSIQTLEISISGDSSCNDVNSSTEDRVESFVSPLKHDFASLIAAVATNPQDTDSIPVEDSKSTILPDLNIKTALNRKTQGKSEDALDSIHGASVTADELIPALIWVVIQTNIPNIDAILWLCSEMRHPDLLHGEEAFCLSQLCSAVEFCRSVSPESLEMSFDEYDARICAFNADQDLLLHCRRGNFEGFRKALADDASPNALSVDQLESALSLCIRYNRHEEFEELLSYQSMSGEVIDVDMAVSPLHGDVCNISPLLLAVQFNRIHMVLLLLRKGADRYITDSLGNTPLVAAQARGDSQMQNLLSVDPTICGHHVLTLIERGDIDAVTSLSLQNTSMGAVYFNSHKNLWMTPLVACIESIDVAMLRRMLSTAVSLHQPLLPVHYENGIQPLSAIFIHNRSVLEFTQKTKQKDDLFGHSISQESLNKSEVSEAVSTISGSPFHELCDEELSYFSPLIRCVLLFCDEYKKGNIHNIRSLLVMAIMLLRGETFFSREGWSVRRLIWSRALAILQQVCASTKTATAFVDGSQLSPLIGKILQAFTGNNDNLSSAPAKSSEPDFSKAFSDESQSMTLQSLSESADVYLTLMCSLLSCRCADPPIPAFKYAEDADLTGLWSLLVLSDSDINHSCPERGITALIAASFLGNLAMIELLMQVSELATIGDFAVDSYFIDNSTSNSNNNIGNSKHASADQLEDIFPLFNFPSPMILHVNAADARGMTALHYAAQKNDPVLVGRLLGAGADRYTVNSDGLSPLELLLKSQPDMSNVVVDMLKYDPTKIPICMASRHDDWAVMSALLRQCVSINTMRDDAPTSAQPMHSVANRRRSKSIVDEKITLEVEAQWKSFNSTYTPLIAAAAHCNTVLVMNMLRLAPIIYLDLNCRNQQGRTALMYAAQQLNEGLILMLLNAGADRTIRDNDDQTAESLVATILYEASLPAGPNKTVMASPEKAKRAELILSILRNDPRGSFLLGRIRKTDYDGVVSLLKQGASPLEQFPSPFIVDNVLVPGDKRTRYPDGCTPLMAAAIETTDTASEAGLRIMRRLLSIRDVFDSIDTVDFDKGWSALFHAAYCGNEVAVLELLRAGANRRKLDKRRLSASDAAIAGGFVTVAAIIHADPKKVHIHDACSKGELAIVTAILKQGCPLNYRDERPDMFRFTPLIAACAASKYPVVKLILTYNSAGAYKGRAGIDEQDTEGRTALMLAVSVGATNITELLLAAGCDRDIVDANGMTAATYASKHSMTTYLQFVAQKMIH